MKLDFLRVVRMSRASLALLACLAIWAAVPAWATPPILEKPANFTYPSEVLTGSTQEFQISYVQSSGDKPRSMLLVIQTPSGGTTKIEPTTPPSGDPSQGPVVTDWLFVPQDAGNYKFHFETTSATGEQARYPATEGEDLEFAAESLVTKYIILIVGLIVALGFLPFVVYIGTRAANKRSDPSVAARIALLIGVLASYALFIYLFHSIYSVLLNVIVAIIAVALLIVLFTRRR